MPKFSYVAVSAEGKEKKGTIEATDELSVRLVLRADNLIPVKVGLQSVLEKEIHILPEKGVKPRDLSVFCRQMASLLDSGITIVNALDMLEQQTENKRLKAAITEAGSIVEKGESLSSALNYSPKVFPPMLVNMVASGEASGTLDRTFGRMAIHFEKSSKLRAMVQKAMVYPIMMSIIAAIVVVVMSVVVVPQFVSLFDSMGVELPLITRFVVGVSNFFMYRWYIVIALLAAITFAVKQSKKTEKGKLFWGFLKIKMPVFGKLAVKNVCANFSRTMSTLISSGISLSEALDITSRAVENEVFKREIQSARREIERGSTLSEPLKNSGLFPTMVHQMLSIGEETGNIEGMLTKVAEYYEEEVEMATGALNAIMEPIIIVVMGVIIGFITIAIYMPIISMYSGMDTL